MGVCKSEIARVLEEHIAEHRSWCCCVAIGEDFCGACAMAGALLNVGSELLGASWYTGMQAK